MSVIMIFTSVKFLLSSVPISTQSTHILCHKPILNVNKRFSFAAICVRASTVKQTLILNTVVKVDHETRRYSCSTEPKASVFESHPLGHCACNVVYESMVNSEKVKHCWIAINKHMLLPLLLRVCCPNRFQSNSFHNAHKISRYAQMTSRNAYMTSRFSVPASAGPLLPLLKQCMFLKINKKYSADALRKCQ